MEELGLGICSTSHVEALWHQLKTKIKKIYSSIPSINFLLFPREAEWLIKNQKLNDEQKTIEFVEYYRCYDNKIDVKEKKNLYLVNSDFSK